LETTKYVIILTMNQGRNFTEELIKEQVTFDCNQIFTIRQNFLGN
jgi:hypothetical protein